MARDQLKVAKVRARLLQLSHQGQGQGFGFTNPARPHHVRARDPVVGLNAKKSETHDQRCNVS